MDLVEYNPLSWAPEWVADMGPFVIRGIGLLTARVNAEKHAVQRFTVFVKPHNRVLVVDLRTGEITLNRTTYLTPSGLIKRRMIWFRRMVLSEANAFREPTCSYYGLGWQATVDGRNVKFGLRILPDGSIKQGL
jgi:hypothetical protein